MTFEAFKAEFDATFGRMTDAELQAAIKAAGLSTEDEWSRFTSYSSEDYTVYEVDYAVCGVGAELDNQLALAA